MTFRSARAEPAHLHPSGVVGCLLALVVTAACGGRPSPAVSTGAAGPPPSASPSAAPGQPAAVPPAAAGTGSVFGQATGAQVAVYAQATGTDPVRTLASPNADGAPTVFLLQQSQTTRRVQVLLPVRPNGSTGWVDRDQLRLFTTPYRLVISVAQHRLQEYRAGQLVGTDPVGIGRGVTPTPSGTYYLTELLQPPDPNGPYGPYAYGLSAYSPVLTDFAGGPGQIGLHGTNDPAGLGTDVSHGCIRVANIVITRLARTVPPGTPVTINQQ